MKSLRIAPATSNDLQPIKELLLASDLPIAGVDEHWKTFVVAYDGEALAGCGGAEAYDDAALIRSIAVAAQYRSRGVGGAVVGQLIDDLRRRGVRRLYLLTTTAEKYFQRRGFETCERAAVDPRLLRSREFQDACPVTAVCMRLAIDD